MFVFVDDNLVLHSLYFIMKFFENDQINLQTINIKKSKQGKRSKNNNDNSKKMLLQLQLNQFDYDNMLKYFYCDLKNYVSMLKYFDPIKELNDFGTVNRIQLEQSLNKKLGFLGLTYFVGVTNYDFIDLNNTFVIQSDFINVVEKFNSSLEEILSQKLVQVKVKNYVSNRDKIYYNVLTNKLRTFMTLYPSLLLSSMKNALITKTNESYNDNYRKTYVSLVTSMTNLLDNIYKKYENYVISEKKRL